MKQILVTGCRGQLGSELQKLAPAYDETCVFHFTDVDELDITDRQAVYDYIEAHSISIVVNCAAFTAVDRAESEPELCDLLNNVAPGYLAEAVESVGGTMIQVSTDYVFDGCGHRPYLEDDPTRPQTVYGRTKLEGEEAVIRTCAGSMVVRTAWLYSTFGNNFVKTMLRLGKERETLGVVFDQVGSPTYARDLAAFILTAIDKGIVPGVYHYTNEGVCSWYDFTHEIFARAQSSLNKEAAEKVAACQLRSILSSEYQYQTPRPHYSVLNKAKIKRTFGIAIPHWTDALQVCLEKLLKE